MRLRDVVRRSPALSRVAVSGLTTRSRLSRAGAAPRVLANSIPKSGTHLMAAVLNNLPDMQFCHRRLYSETYVERERLLERLAKNDVQYPDLARLRADLSKVKRGQYAGAHLYWAQELVDVLEALGYKTLFMMRNPRAMLVSGAHFILDDPLHPLHRSFAARASNLDHAIALLIEGFPPGADGFGIPDYGQRLSGYLGWLATPGVLPVRFESLVGQRGGGSAEEQRKTVEEIAAFVDRPLSDGQVDEVAEVIWSSQSTTFRQGRIDSWSESITEQHEAALQHHAGTALAALGYA